MAGRIRRSVEAAMSQVESTTAEAMRLMLELAEKGFTIEVSSLLGYSIPKTRLLIRLADDDPPTDPNPQNEVSG